MTPPRFEPATSRIQVISVTACATLIGLASNIEQYIFIIHEYTALPEGHLWGTENIFRFFN
jgi:hypothetical protein